MFYIKNTVVDCYKECQHKSWDMFVVQIITSLKCQVNFLPHLPEDVCKTEAYTDNRAPQTLLVS